MSKVYNCKIKFNDKMFFNPQKIEFPYKFYYPIVIDNYYDNGAWTAEIIILDYHDGTSNGIISFLMDNAPNHLIVLGKTFVLSPGFKRKDSNDNYEELVINGVGEII